MPSSSRTEKRLIFLLIFICPFIPSRSILAQENPSTPKEEKAKERIPERPSRPPKLRPGSNITPFGPDRRFKINDTVYTLDSYYRQDGEGLRSFIKNVPEAVQELKLYQKNQENRRLAAYTGTVGLVIVVSSIIFKNQFPQGARQPIQNFGLISGVGLTASSFLYGIGTYQKNKAHLRKAIHHYNQAHPKNPIQIELEASFAF